VAFLLKHSQDVGAYGVVRLVQPEDDGGFGAVGRFRHNCCCNNNVPLLLAAQVHAKGVVMSLVTYRIDEGTAIVTMDDGKRNALSLEMFAALSAAFDRAEQERVPVVLTGSPGTFSAGFDLKVMMAGGKPMVDMVRTGFELGERLLGFPTPVVAACTGHAVAMGAFLLLAADYRVGVEGDFRIQANEVAIGITMPFFGVEICRQRLTPACFNRAVLNSESFAPGAAVAAGFLDRVVPPADVERVALQKAAELAKLNAAAFAATKLRARAGALQAVRAAIEADGAIFAQMI
jgi:enoyl-CoA hydratase